MTVSVENEIVEEGCFAGFCMSFQYYLSVRKNEQIYGETASVRRGWFKVDVKYFEMIVE